MNDLFLTESEKKWCRKHLIENMFDAGEADVHYLDPPMVKLLNYIGMGVPYVIDVVDDCRRVAYTIQLVAN